MTKTKEAVIVVDYQNDFANPETGSLYVNSWETIAEAINKVVLETKQNWWIVLASRELHPQGHISFASNYINKTPITDSFAIWKTPDKNNFININEVDSELIAPSADFKTKQLKKYLEKQENKMDAVWPDHCVENTFGSEFYEKFDASQVDFEIKKGFEVDEHPYSVFGGKTLDEQKTTLEILKEFWVKIVKVVGLATEYCDIQTALDAKKYWFQVQFIKEATAWVAPAGTIEALNKMRENWIKIID